VRPNSVAFRLARSDDKFRVADNPEVISSVSTSQVPGLELPYVAVAIGLQKMRSKPYALANPVMTKRSVFWSQYF
jgi:hypothetical protein